MDLESQFPQSSSRQKSVFESLELTKTTLRRPSSNYCFIFLQGFQVDAALVQENINVLHAWVLFMVEKDELRPTKTSLQQVAKCKAFVKPEIFNN